MGRVYSIFQYIVIFTLVMSLVACESDNFNHNEDQPVGKAENIFDNIPLRILVNSDKSTDYGIPNTNSLLFSRLRLLNLDAQISKECEEKFGFPIEFFSIEKREPGQSENNDYRLFLESGEIADLIFPTRTNPYSDRHSFWMEDFFHNGYYKDLTPYLSTYCPDVYLNMQKYDYIQKMVTRDEKVYAVYAGVPDVSIMALQVKNELLAKYKKQDIRNFDELFAFMEAISIDEDDEGNNRILVSSLDLLKYAVIKAGYYPFAYRNLIIGSDIVFKVDDPECKPYFIEDTNIVDVFFEEFLPFFEESYFIGNLENHALANIRLTNDIFTNTYFNVLYNGKEGYPSINDYSMFLFDADSTVVDSINSILLIPVPYTSTQPEKALSFVNWLFTDEKMSDYLSYGTDQGQFPNYKFDDDGYPMYYQDGCSVYMFHSLIANFSDGLMPFHNKTFDRVHEYKKFAEKAVYPPLYQYVESEHSLERYSAYLAIEKEYKPYEERWKYLIKVMDELINDPESRITVDEIKEELRYMTDEQEFLFFLEEKLHNIVEEN